MKVKDLKKLINELPSDLDDAETIFQLWTSNGAKFFLNHTNKLQVYDHQTNKEKFVAIAFADNCRADQLIPDDNFKLNY